jgi:ubiquinone/menaquinone biosynthesis C-methylase UbiE
VIASGAPDFSRLARRYDELRPADANWHEVLERLVALGRLTAGRVLDVGCGTGRVSTALAERGSKVWGVDPEPGMLEIARARVPAGVGLKEGRAEALPFRDGWFDAAVCWLTVHLVDRPAAFAEVHRILVHGGRLAIATFDPTHFDAFWLNRLFPSLEAVDRARFPRPEQLEAELAAAGLEPRLERLSQTGSLSRDEALDKIRGRHISTFQLLGDEEYAAGLERAERELPARIDYAVEWLLARGVRGGRHDAPPAPKP